ncbi:UNVERIFIED_CONTAM: hypothetical protein Sradi_4573800 [Sesamum radiatum]|uniref:Uncharacterized protein n=1 Tax=Sesamum radiatum TaxID=300843 RepID=A0AAW2NCA5_SESRA
MASLEVPSPIQEVTSTSSPRVCWMEISSNPLQRSHLEVRWSIGWGWEVYQHVGGASFQERRAGRKDEESDGGGILQEVRVSVPRQETLVFDRLIS